MSDLQDLQDIDVDRLIGRRATDRWNRTSVGDLIERVTWSYPDKEAIVAGPGACASPHFARLSYRQADALANRIANALIARGLRHGDRLLFICENSVEAYLTKFGAAKAGVVCAPINPRMAPDVVDHLLRVLQPALAIVDDELLAPFQETLQRHGVGGVVVPITGQPPVAGWTPFEAFVQGMPETAPEVPIHGDDIWQIIPTSGTTSMPKGVMMSHHFAYMSAYSHALGHSRGLRWEADLRLCCLLPTIYHAADTSHSFPAYLCGGTFVLGRKAGPRDVAELVSRERVTALWSGSSQFLAEVVRAVDAEPQAFDLSSLTSILFTWAALPPSTADALKRLCRRPDLQLVEILGQTEALSSTRFWPDRWPEVYRAKAPQVNHVGVPNPLLAAALMRDDGTLIDRTEVGVPGEIVYRSPSVSAGYYRDAKATAESVRHGWFHSGDCCAYDETGLLVMLDRYKDVIKTGGENVSTLRVEAVLQSHPAVQKASVIGLPHERWGEAVTAVVVRRPDEAVDEAQLIAHCGAVLARYETPKRVIFVDRLPESVGGKVQKHLLRHAHQDFYSNPAAAETGAQVS